VLFDESDIDRNGAKGLLGQQELHDCSGALEPCRLIRLDPAAASLIVRHHKIFFGRIVSHEKQDF
jgi:hypothetical protein